MGTIEKLLSGTQTKTNNKQEGKENVNSSKKTVTEKEMKWIINTLIGIPVVLRNEYERWEYEIVMSEFKDERSQVNIDDSQRYLKEIEKWF